MSNISGNDYKLGYGFVSLNRLNLQAYLWRDSLKYGLHPTIDLPTSSLRVADVGCGTGIWLLQLHQDLNRDNVELHGFDVNTKQSPPEAWLPKEITIEQWNLFEEPPQKLLGKYDIVHIRMFMINIVEDPSPVIKNLWKIIKPGGWLQWEEINHLENVIVLENPNCKQEALERWLKFGEKSAEKQLGKHNWLVQLPKTLEHLGFSNVKVEKHLDPPHLALYFFEMWLQTTNEYIGQNLEGTEEGREATKLVEDAWEEVQAGAVLRLGKQVYLTQKAL